MFRMRQLLIQLLSRIGLLCNLGETMLPKLLSKYQIQNRVFSIISSILLCSSDLRFRVQFWQLAWPHQMGTCQNNPNYYALRNMHHKHTLPMQISYAHPLLQETIFKIASCLYRIIVWSREGANIFIWDYPA